MSDFSKQNAVSTGIAGLVMSLYGFLLGGITVFPDLGKTYELTIDLFNGMVKVGGVGLMLVAVIGYFSASRIAILLDCIVSGLCGMIMVMCAVGWIAYEKSVDLQTIMILIFGAMFLRSASGSWRQCQSADATMLASDEGEDNLPAKGFFGIKPLSPPEKPLPSSTEQIHPASLHPESLPKEGDPPPEGGYLAALSKEEEEPPSASFE